MKSLFLVALPRSLTTRTYHLCREALGLAEPVWTSDGEVLNLDRFALRARDEVGLGRKFLHPRWEPERFRQTLAQLDQVTREHGFAYKDVVQPFAVTRWLPTRDFRILRIQRPVVDVAHAMLERGWHYPRNAAEGRPELESEVLEGLHRAEHALADLPGEVVAFDQLTHDESALHQALRRLYPEASIPALSYIDEEFLAQRREVEARRATPAYQRLLERYQDVVA